MWILDEKPTKEKQRYLTRYNDSDCFNIRYAYKNPSSTKVAIWRSYLEKYPDPVGPWKITSANCFTFTMAAVVKEENKYYLYYITPSKDIKLCVKHG